MKVKKSTPEVLCLDCDNHAGGYCRAQINGFPQRIQCASFNDGLGAHSSIIQLPAPRAPVVEPPQEVVVWQDEKKALALSYINIPKD
jgi:hypothetical protein